jgi:GNAT superfamily N-acetyltransferase
MQELSGQFLSIDGMKNRLDFVKESPFDSIYVFEECGIVKGTLSFRIRENIREVSKYGEICILVVGASYKKQGIGRTLMEFAEQKAETAGCKGTYLISGMGRKAEAPLFYQELGYEITGYRFVKPLP